MAEEEKKKSPANESGSGGFWDVMGRMGEGLIDGLAQSNPIVGLPLQAGFNTAGYQDKQLRRQAAKEALLTSQQRNAEWRDEAPLREKQRRNAETQADEFARGADDRESERKRRRMELAEYAAGAPARAMQRDEYLQNAPVREAQNGATLARANLAAEQSDTLYMQGRCAALRDGLKKDLLQNPAFVTMSFAEQDDFCNSPRVQTMIEAKYYLGELQSIGQRDQGAFGRMDRALRRQGWNLIDGEDGIKYLDMGERGRVPATKEAIDALNKQITTAALEELNTRSMLADASTMGNPARRSIAARTKALMPYNANDATASMKMVQGVFDTSSEQEKGWHLFHQAIADYQSSGLPTAAKMDGLSACMPFLQKMGYAIEGLDPKNPNVDAVTVIDLKNKTRLSFSEFAKRCEDNDSLGKRLDERIGQAQWGYLMQQSGKTFANAGVRGTVPKTGTGKKPAATTAEQSDPDAPLHKDLSAEFGDNYNALPDKSRTKMISAKREWDADRDDVLKKYGVSSVSELPDEALKTLEESWGILMDNAGMDAKKFYSPVNSMIRKRNITTRTKQTADAERKVDETQQFNEDWDNNYHGGDDAPGEAFGRNFRLARERAERDRTKKRNDTEINEHRRILERRWK